MIPAEECTCPCDRTGSPQRPDRVEGPVRHTLSSADEPGVRRLLRLRPAQDNCTDLTIAGGGQSSAHRALVPVADLVPNGF
jgi:hypothetical protein